MLMTMRSQIEAMRALCYFGGTALDKAASLPAGAEQQQSQYLINFLIPIIKGWCTETANELTSLGVQVHGGMGFIEETGAAQYMRDARIAAIYEGTTGIHGMDLIGRKMASEKAATLKAVLGEVEKTIAELAAAGGEFASIKAGLEMSTKAAKEAAEYILANFADNTKKSAAGSVPFLMLMGVTLGGWLLAKSALIAKARLAAGDADADFYRAKITTTRFFAEHIAPRTLAYGYEVVNGADSTLELADELF